MKKKSNKRKIELTIIKRRFDNEFEARLKAFITAAERILPTVFAVIEPLLPLITIGWIALIWKYSGESITFADAVAPILSLWSLSGGIRLFLTKYRKKINSDLDKIISKIIR